MIALASWAQYLVTFRAGAADFVVHEALVFKLHLVLGMDYIFDISFHAHGSRIQRHQRAIKIPNPFGLSNRPQTLIGGGRLCDNGQSYRNNR